MVPGYPASARCLAFEALALRWQERLPSLASRLSSESEKEADGGTVPASWGARHGRLPPPVSPQLGVRAEMRDTRAGRKLALGLMAMPAKLWLTLRGAGVLDPLL